MLNAPKLDPWENLLEMIRGEAELPAAKPYLPEAGDPLDRLIRRMRGEDVDAQDTAEASMDASMSAGLGPADTPETPGAPASRAPAAGVEAQLGREVMEMLRSAALPGPARAAAAELLSAQLHGLEGSNMAPSAAEGAAVLRRVLRILVTTQYD